jgi:hypothetical protein
VVGVAGAIPQAARSRAANIREIINEMGRFVFMQILLRKYINLTGHGGGEGIFGP